MSQTTGGRWAWPVASFWVRAYAGSSWVMAAARLGVSDAPVPPEDARWQAQLEILGARLEHTTSPEVVWESVDRVVAAWWGIGCEGRARLHRIAFGP